ncbi:LCP family protein [Protaetiibacter intestinalis]|uniref:LCP family protein n=1 Tax=Protaetiibacter intestinalis TaxID=2419774 RepID=UPI0013002497|nr:LCP family protein [Protaetiibacter intestinalis]
MTAVRWVASGLAVVLVATVAVVGIEVSHFAQGLRERGVVINASEAPIPEIGAIEGGFNILVVGKDEYYDRDSVLNDVNILLHVSEDQTSAVAVSFPRDMVMPFPPCTDPKTGRTSSAARGLPVNNAYAYGGLGCVVDVLRGFTGLEIQYAGLIGFDGVASMADAVGGVPVCVASPIDDAFTGLHLDAGTHTLSGWEALMFLRTRHGVGDGSDLTRISSQQVYLSALVRKLTAEGTLTNVTTIVGLAQIASEKMELSAELTNPTTMVAMARALHNIPLERLTFVQYPGTTGGTGIYEGHVQPDAGRGQKLLDAIRNDQSVGVAQAGDGVGAQLDPNATETPVDPSASPGDEPTLSEQVVIDGIRGQSAADQTCSIGR